MERSRNSTRARRAPWLVLLAAAMVLAGCGTETTDTAESAENADSADATAATAEGSDDGVPLVVVSTNILGDIVQNVAGDEATVEVLMPLGANPHSFEPSAQQAALMRDADLVVANGLGLEEGLLTAIEAAEEDGVRVLEVGPSLDPAP